MPTITIPEKTLIFLKDFMHEINNQDNRATASPYYYDLRYKEYDEEKECNVEKHVGYRGNIFLTAKAADNYIKENSHNLPEGVYTFLCWAGRNRELMGLLDAIGEVTGLGHNRR